jgi:hypothetical protein
MKYTAGEDIKQGNLVYIKNNKVYNVGQINPKCLELELEFKILLKKEEIFKLMSSIYY